MCDHLINLAFSIKGWIVCGQFGHMITIYPHMGICFGGKGFASSVFFVDEYV